METQFKPKMTDSEMEVAFSQAYPGLIANPQNVGRFAKKMGYKRSQQMVDKVIVRFYYKQNV